MLPIQPYRHSRERLHPQVSEPWGRDFLPVRWEYDSRGHGCHVGRIRRHRCVQRAQIRVCAEPTPTNSSSYQRGSTSIPAKPAVPSQHEGGWSHRPCHRGPAKWEPLNAGVRPAAGPGISTPGTNCEGGEGQDSRAAEPRSPPESGQAGSNLCAKGGSDPRCCPVVRHPGNRFLYRGRAWGGGDAILPIQPGFVNGPAARTSLCPEWWLGLNNYKH